jgi:hypothetical protein
MTLILQNIRHMKNLNINHQIFYINIKQQK